MLRKIIHIDMDAFYASIEQRDFPEYRGKPIAVGGSPEGRGGVVATASYEARKFGVRSAMSSKKALQLCPHLIFVRPRFDAYKEASRRIREIFKRHTDMIEPLSLDEAYLDVTVDKQKIGSAIEIAKQILADIRTELKLTASAGVSVNKFVAKIASDIKKPNGLTFIGPSRIERFMEELPIEKFHGIGKVTAEKMRKLGLFTGYDLKQLSEQQLLKNFGKPGRFFFNIVRGHDEREVQPHRETKSVGAEDTFRYDLTTLAEMEEELDKIAQIVSDRLRRHSLKGKTLTLKVRFHDFKQITRSQSSEELIGEHEAMLASACRMLREAIVDDQKVRLLGISVSGFRPEPPSPKTDLPDQLRLF